jgi:quercetin dioxygenase-like cupin family protein
MRKASTMIRTLLLTAVSGAAALAHAQDPVLTDGDKYRPLLDNPCVRVLEYRDRPGDKTQAHRHPAFVLYAVGPCKRKLHLSDGQVLAREFKAGDVMWSPAQTHVGENVGDTPTHVLIVEAKPGAPAACAAP